ncbi:MAG TPA: hypothetical protein VE465_01125 [Streptosporangiaceae bacterium]|jgi:hypothetical protein|nr:hypothetical protein [Streptosporangiaceae bacterium]
MSALAPELAPEHARAWLDRWDRQQAALRAAGFGEVGTLWQRGETRLLCAVR